MSDIPRTDAAYKMTAKYGFYELFNECSKLERELNAFHPCLSAVMPPDFKDWHQNSKQEWPQIAAEVIQNLRIDRDKGWEIATKKRVDID